MLSLYSNIPASRSSTLLAAHFSSLSDSVQRLSTGLRVNSAADDAAGLAIRELMRSNIAAFGQGMRNANDAISLLQVADGALGIIDEKLIRMKELAEQAATGTYNSTQRLIIHSEFQAMGSEIDRIARATTFNGVKLLDGSLVGEHDGSGLESSGALKVHFGVCNDSAEDYYYIDIDDCSTAGLGLRSKESSAMPGSPSWAGTQGEMAYEDVIAYPPFAQLNDYETFVSTHHGSEPFDITTLEEGKWYCGVIENTAIGSQNTMLLVKAGTKGFVLNEIGTTLGDKADNDIQLFTRDGKHLAGRSPIPDYESFPHANKQNTNLQSQCGYMGFTIDQYDASQINRGAGVQNNGQTMNFTTYNGMTIGYSGDGPADYDNVARYEVLAIDEVTEDLIVWLPGVAGAVFKYYTNGQIGAGAALPPAADESLIGLADSMIGIETQEKAQKALTSLDDAIVKKDQTRAHLGALQNRLENTVANIGIQLQNLQSSESRISDADIAREMTEFVKNQVLSQSAAAILAQANSLPNMVVRLLQG